MAIPLELNTIQIIALVVTLSAFVIFVYNEIFYKIPTPNPKSKYPRIIKIRQGSMEFDLNKSVIVYKNGWSRPDVIYQTLKGTYVLFSVGAYQNYWEIISRERMKQYIIQQKGYRTAEKYFPELTEELRNYESKI